MKQKCVSCGANVSRHDQFCSYCGSENPEYYPPEREVNLLLEKGMAAFQNAHYAEAIDCYQQVIAIDSDVFDAYFYLASAYSTLKRYEEAVEVMEQAQRIRPGSAPVYYNLGILCKQLGRKAEARAYLEKALALVNEDPAVDGARKEFKKAIKKALAEYKRWKLF